MFAEPFYHHNKFQTILSLTIICVMVVTFILFTTVWIRHSSYLSRVLNRLRAQGKVRISIGESELKVFIYIYSLWYI